MIPTDSFTSLINDCWIIIFKTESDVDFKILICNSIQGMLWP